MPGSPAPRPSARHIPLALHVSQTDPRAKGRMMSPEDIIAIHPAGKGGRKPSRYTIITRFLPDKKRKTGQTVWWWESDVMAHFDESFAQPGDA